MTREELKKIILDSLWLVKNENPRLNLARIGERSIVARIAFYINEKLSGLKGISVDCEYNIDGFGDPKRFNGIGEELRNCAEKVRRRVYDDNNSIRIIPDLVIHTRGTKANNIAVIEFKIQGDSKNEFRYAEEKLRAFQDDSYGYKYAMAVLVTLASNWDNFESSQVDFIEKHVKESGS